MNCSGRRPALAERPYQYLEADPHPVTRAVVLAGARQVPQLLRLVGRLRCIRRPHFETGVGIAALALGHVLLLVALVLDRDPETSRDVALVAHSAGCPS